MNITKHTNDWCHICGKRQQELVDIWYAENAESQTEENMYIRICKACLLKAISTISLIKEG